MKEITFLNEVRAILSSTEQRKLRYASDINLLNRRENMWKTDRIRVGVIGVTSSGKSTLINALLGDDLLSVAVRPSSSQLVSCSYANNRSATVYFLNGTQKTIGDNAQLKRSIVQYSDEGCNKQNEKKVAQLELSTPNFDLGKDVLLVDSPGLDASGYAAHEKLTLETLLPTVDVVIYVTTVKSEVDQKMKATLDTIAKNNCPVMIVQNMLDSVRASVDGKKSVEVVAEERMNRVREAVKKSKIKNKNEVKISQISAINAMKYRCQKNHNKEEERNYKRSRYERFVKDVKDLVAYKRPEIEKQRVNTILQYIEGLIQQEDIRTQNINTSAVVDNTLISIANKIRTSLDTTYNDIQSVIIALQNIYDKYFNESRNAAEENNIGVFFSLSSFFNLEKKSLGEEEIQEIKQVVQQFETKVVESVHNFSMDCSEAIKALGLPTRDMWSYNGLPRMPEIELKTKIDERERQVKKKGFIHTLGRILTLGIYSGTETEHYTVTVIDNEATWESAKRYIERLQAEYGKTLETWQKNAQSTVASIQREIDLRVAAIREKEKLVADAVDWKKIRESLMKYISQYKGNSDVLKQPIKTMSDEQSSEAENDMKLLEVPRGIIELHDAAKKYLYAVQTSLFRHAMESCARSGYPAWIVSNSSDNLSDFLYRFYRVPKNDFDKGTVHKISNTSDTVTVACSPTEEQLKSIRNASADMNVFLLINGMQFHTDYETVLRKNVQNNLKERDALFVVIHDFETIANGNAITESINGIRIFQKSNKGIVLISHENPIYNMAMIQVQTTAVKLKEETEFYRLLNEKFPFLVDEEGKKRINHIMRTQLDEERNLL